MISTAEIRAVYEHATAQFIESREFQVLVSGRASEDFVRQFLLNVFRTHYLSAHIVALCFAALPSNAAESEVNRAISQANTVAGKIENCNQMSAVADEAQPGVYRELGSVPVGDLPEQVRTIAINQPIDVPSPPVRTNQGVGLYMICARQGADEDSQSRTAIADRLGQQRLETLARGYLSDLRRAAVIDIRM
jgi:peptidyl-prolyl cis-trans isomerase SurA